MCQRQGGFAKENGVRVCGWVEGTRCLENKQRAIFHTSVGKGTKACALRMPLPVGP